METSNPALHLEDTLSYVHYGLKEGAPDVELGANSLEGLKYSTPKSWILFNLDPKSLCSQPLSPSFSSGRYQLASSHLMKAAGFHGYPQARSKVSFLGGSSITQITKTGPLAR